MKNERKRFQVVATDNRSVSDEVVQVFVTFPVHLRWVAHPVPGAVVRGLCAARGERDGRQREGTAVTCGTRDIPEESVERSWKRARTPTRCSAHGVRIPALRSRRFLRNGAGEKHAHAHQTPENTGHTARVLKASPPSRPRGPDWERGLNLGRGPGKHDVLENALSG